MEKSTPHFPSLRKNFIPVNAVLLGKSWTQAKKWKYS